MTYTTEMPDWANRLKNKQSIIPAPIYPAEAEKALSIFKQLRIPDIAGQPTFAEVSEPWLFDYVAAIFGAYDSETGQQHIRESLLLVSKKNSKSTLAAAIMLTALILCWRQEEEHLILAPTKEIADNSFKPAAAMVRIDEELSEMFHVQDHLRIITHREMRNTLKVVAADTDTVAGKKAGRILIDELWVFGSKSKADGMLMEATGGLVSRPEGFVIYLTTQSDDAPAGVFKERLDYARDVRDGVIKDPRFLPVLYEFPDDMLKNKAYLNPENFYISNPNLGRSVSQQWIVENLERNRNKQDGGFQKFIAKHLNIEIGLSLRNDRWAGADFWEQSASEAYSLEELIERSEVIMVGVDGGGLDDLLGFYVMGREYDSQKKLGWGYAWAHPSVLQRRQEIAPRLQDFARDGEMTLVKQVGDDIEEMAMLCEQAFDSGKLFQIGVDSHGLPDIVDTLERIGIECQKYVTEIPQGWKLGKAIKASERWLADGTFKPSKQGLMSWAVSNAKIEPRANGILITKQASGTAKIDPVIALLNCAALMSLNPEGQAGFEEFLRNPIIV